VRYQAMTMALRSHGGRSAPTPTRSQVEREHGLSTQHARRRHGLLHHRPGRQQSEPIDLVAATHSERHRMMRSHAAGTPVSDSLAVDSWTRPEVTMQEPLFHTVHEAAQILRVDPATIYRSIRAGAFPAIRIRSRYVIPAAALREVAEQAVSSGTCVDLTDSSAPAFKPHHK
jgi:excisionase family DNA binding protein